MNYRFLLATVIVLFFICCKSDIKIDFMADIKPVSSELLDIDCLVGKPHGIVVYDTLLFLYDPYEDKILTVVNTNNSQCVNRVLRTGQGPGDVILPLKMSVSPQQKQLYVSQQQSGVLNTYSFSGKDLVFIESVRLKYQPAQAVATRDAIVGIGIFEDGRYHIYDKKGNFQQSAGVYPFSGESMNVMTRFLMYQGYICAQPNGTHYALGSAYSDNMEFYEIQNDQIKMLKQYGSQDVKATLNNTLQLDEDCLLGYKWAYGTDKYCYMLYLGKTYAEHNHQKQWAANIFVFQWNGSFVKSFKLDREILAFCVDEANENIYAIATNKDEYAIVKFKI